MRPASAQPPRRRSSRAGAPAGSQGVFLGVDLAWDVDRRHTGIAVMEGGMDGVQLTQIAAPVRSLAGVCQQVAHHLSGLRCMVVAVDASLIVPNETGQRPCEQAIGRTFGKYGASCHSSNRRRPHFDSGARLCAELAAHGFVHGVPLPVLAAGRFVLEVYPHPAMVRLFGLRRVLRYKKGTVAGRRAGLRILQGHIEGLAGRRSGLESSPCLEALLACDPQSRGGQALKELEDQLDAVLCAYLAWHAWRWGEARNEVFGDLDNGYIVVPRAPDTVSP